MDDDFWNRPDEEIVEELRHCYEKHGCNIEVSDFLNHEYLLQKVLPRVYSDENIAQLKKNHIVYRHEMDLAFSFLYSDTFGNRIGTCVHNNNRLFIRKHGRRQR